MGGPFTCYYRNLLENFSLIFYSFGEMVAIYVLILDVREMYQIRLQNFSLTLFANKVFI